MAHPENVLGWIVWLGAALLLGLAAAHASGCSSASSSPSAACTAVRSARAAAELAEPYVCELDGGVP